MLKFRTFKHKIINPIRRKQELKQFFNDIRIFIHYCRIYNSVKFCIINLTIALLEWNNNRETKKKKKRVIRKSVHRKPLKYSENLIMHISTSNSNPRSTLHVIKPDWLLIKHWRNKVLRFYKNRIKPNTK